MVGWRNRAHHSSATEDLRGMASRSGDRQRKTDFDVPMHLHKILGPKQNSRARNILGLPLVPLGVSEPPIAHGKVKRKSGSPHMLGGRAHD